MFSIHLKEDLLPAERSIAAWMQYSAVQPRPSMTASRVPARSDALVQAHALHASRAHHEKLKQGSVLRASCPQNETGGKGQRVLSSSFCRMPSTHIPE